MKFALASLLILLFAVDPAKIGKVNTAKSAARKAYVAGDYKKAVQQYRYLTDSLAVTEDEVRLNLANSYFQLNDTTNAMSNYQSLTGSPKPQIRSKAQQQLGILNHRQGKLDEALNNFKQAIKADANNMDARYNYEMLKKKLEEQKQQEQNQQSKDQQQKNKEENKDQQNKEQQNKEQEKKEQEKKEQEQKEKQQKEQQEKEQQQKDQQNKEEKEKKDQESKEQKQNEEQDKKENSPQLSKKLEQMKISEEKAKMILDAMKNQEIQYLQQNKRKATVPRDKSKPDW
jgi:Ca-activated chloride channel homolog